MKKGKKLLVTASLVSTAMTVGGCRFLPWMNIPSGVYGPPPDEYVTATPVPRYEEGDDAETALDPVTEEEGAFSPEVQETVEEEVLTEE